METVNKYRRSSDKYKEYAYTSYNSFVEKATVLVCLNDSLMFKTLDERVEFFTYGYDEDEVKIITKSSGLVCASLEKKELSLNTLSELFTHVENKKDRNKKIEEAISYISAT